ncbi:MAG: hypothetical protein JWO47_1054 [Candidatus Saccharibacteria bacterium]|nr:hypothetical protein [Candidatus Saccharibacteria bacterium]
MAMMIAAMIVPELEGKKTQIHRAVAFITFICFMPLALLLALSGNISPIARVFAGLVAAYELFGMAYLAPKKGYHQKALWFQISFIGSFHLTIIAATYLR